MCFCCFPVTVNAAPQTPAAPEAVVSVQPNCSTATGTIVVSAPVGGDVQYALDGGAYQSSPTFSGVSAGVHSVTVKTLPGGCVSAASSVTVNAAPQTPAAPEAVVSVQPNCSTATGTIVVSAPVGGDVQYALDGGAYQSSPTFSGVSAGVHSVTVKTLPGGCVSAASSVTVNAAPQAPCTNCKLLH